MDLNSSEQRKNMEEFLIDIQKQHVTIRESIWKHKIKFDDTRFVKIISKEHKTDEDAEYLLTNMIHYPDIFNLITNTNQQIDNIHSLAKSLEVPNFQLLQFIFQFCKTLTLKRLKKGQAVFRQEDLNNGEYYCIMRGEIGIFISNKMHLKTKAMIKRKMPTISVLKKLTQNKIIVNEEKAMPVIDNKVNNADQVQEFKNFIRQIENIYGPKVRNIKFPKQFGQEVVQRRYCKKRYCTFIVLKDIHLMVIKKEGYEIIRDIAATQLVEQREEIEHIYKIFPDIVTDAKLSQMKLMFVYELSSYVILYSPLFNSPQKQVLKKDFLITQQGIQGNSFYIVNRGRIEIRKKITLTNKVTKQEKTQEIILCEIGKSSIIGEEILYKDKNNKVYDYTIKVISDHVEIFLIRVTQKTHLFFKNQLYERYINKEQCRQRLLQNFVSKNKLTVDEKELRVKKFFLNKQFGFEHSCDEKISIKMENIVKRNVIGKTQHKDGGQGNKQSGDTKWYQSIYDSNKAKDKQKAQDFTRIEIEKYYIEQQQKELAKHLEERDLIREIRKRKHKQLTSHAWKKRKRKIKDAVKKVMTVQKVQNNFDGHCTKENENDASSEYSKEVQEKMTNKYAEQMLKFKNNKWTKFQSNYKKQKIEALFEFSKDYIQLKKDKIGWKDFEGRLAYLNQKLQFGKKEEEQANIDRWQRIINIREQKYTFYNGPYMPSIKNMKNYHTERIHRYPSCTQKRNNLIAIEKAVDNDQSKLLKNKTTTTKRKFFFPAKLTSQMLMAIQDLNQSDYSLLKMDHEKSRCQSKSRTAVNFFTRKSPVISGSTRHKSRGGIRRTIMEQSRGSKFLLRSKTQYSKERIRSRRTKRGFRKMNKTARCKQNRLRKQRNLSLADYQKQKNRIKLSAKFKKRSKSVSKHQLTGYQLKVKVKQFKSYNNLIKTALTKQRIFKQDYDTIVQKKLKIKAKDFKYYNKIKDYKKRAKSQGYFRRKLAIDAKKYQPQLGENESQALIELLKSRSPLANDILKQRFQDPSQLLTSLGISEQQSN